MGGEAGGELVGAGMAVDWGGVGGGFDSGDVQFGKFVDVAQDFGELVSEAGFFFGGEFDSSQVGDVVDV